MRHLDLFSGIGGFALACEWAGIETIGFVEIDKYCQKVLGKHFPDVPIVEDIRNVEKIKQVIENAIGSNGRSENRDIANEGWLASKAGRESIQANSEGRTGVAIADNQPTDFNGQAEGIEPESSAILVTAGFPCQPFSVAGKRQSERDDRYLWPQTIAVIKAVKPFWVLLENVTGIINLALDTVLSDMEGAGYSWETLIIPACAVNAWHRRDRIWIICHTPSNGLNDSQARKGTNPRNQRSSEGEDEVCQSQRAGSLRTIYANTHREGLQGVFNASGEQGSKPRDEQSVGCCGVSGTSQWAVEPELGRVAHGIPNRVDRLKCLGNTIVPQVAYEIIKVIKEVEDG